MRIFIYLFISLVLLLNGCKSKQATASSTSNTANAAQEVSSSPKTTGKVSHQYRATGCATVVTVKLEGQENSLTLIPRTKLPSSLDVDGLEISFNYLPLKMPQPVGCQVGIPAELTDITKK